MTELTDEELVVLIKKGEILSYEVLILRYQKKLTTFVGRWLRDPKDVEEVVQDSLFKVYLGIGRVDEKRKFSSYLYAIARNETISKLRKNKQTLPLMDYVPGEDGEDMYGKLMKKEESGLLYRSLEKLSELQRKVIKMYFFEELSYKGIQKKLGLPLNTVKTLLRRSKISLAKKIKDEN